MHFSKIADIVEVGKVLKGNYSWLVWTECSNFLWENIHVIHQFLTKRGLARLEKISQLIFTNSECPNFRKSWHIKIDIHFQINTNNLNNFLLFQTEQSISLSMLVSQYKLVDIYLVFLVWLIKNFHHVTQILKCILVNFTLYPLHVTWW